MILPNPKIVPINFFVPQYLCHEDESPGREQRHVRIAAGIN